MIKNKFAHENLKETPSKVTQNTFTWQFQYCPKQPGLPRHKKGLVSFELFGALYIFISEANTKH